MTTEQHHQSLPEAVNPGAEPGDTPGKDHSDDARARRRFAAFISYSHRDEVAAAWLHRKLEAYRPPEGVSAPAGMPTRDGRIAPVFRDREELSTSHDLSGAIMEALTNANALIVLCSPASAASHWVNQEIKAFKRLHGEERVFALILEGDENENPVFPPALLQRIGPDGAVIDGAVEHIAADRRADKDGKALAFLKLTAGLLEVRLDDLRQREHLRERRHLRRMLAASVAVIIATVTLAAYAFIQRTEAIEQRAEADRQRVVAEVRSEQSTAALDYLVSLFEIANPATENPKTITALTILERGRKKIDSELGDKPEVRAKLLNAIGSVYHKLGEPQEALPILAEAAKGPFVSLEDEVLANMDYANALTRRRDFAEAGQLIETYEKKLTQSKPVELDGAKLGWLLSHVEEQAAQWSYRQASLDIAIEKYRAARSYCDASSSCDQRRSALLASNLSAVLSSVGKPKKAKAELEFARKTFKDLYGNYHLYTAVTTQNLAYAEFKDENLSVAQDLMTEAVSIYDTLLEENHPTKARANLLLGQILQKINRPDEALDAFEESQRVFEAVYGGDHKQVGVLSIYKALAHAELKSAEAATASMDHAFDVYSKNYSSTDVQMGDLLVNKAIVLHKLGNVSAAVQSCQSGLQIMTASLSVTHDWVSAMRSECTAIDPKFAQNVQ